MHVWFNCLYARQPVVIKNGKTHKPRRTRNAVTADVVFDPDITEQKSKSVKLYVLICTVASCFMTSY